MVIEIHYTVIFKLVFSLIIKQSINILYINQRLPGACNRSPGSKLLSITTQLHCGDHLGGRVQLPDTILEKDHPMTIPSNLVLIELLVPDKMVFM